MMHWASHDDKGGHIIADYGLIWSINTKLGNKRGVTATKQVYYIRHW